MENLILFFIFSLIVVGFIFYKLGSSKKYEIVQTDNKRKQEEQQALEKDIERLKETKNLLTSDCEEKRLYIENAKTKAENEYFSWVDNYLGKFNTWKQERHIEEESLNESINLLKNELNSLKKQKAATIEAFQKEKAIQQEKNLYSLEVSKQDRIDIDFLQSIQYKISKPRLLAMLIWQTYYQPVAKKKFPSILGSQNVCGIYKITNSLNEMSYIGQSVDIKKRWMEHCKCGLGIDTPQNSKLYKAMLEDGLENFTFELLLECPREELNEKEKYYIELYNSIDYGYNSQNGAQWQK